MQTFSFFAYVQQGPHLRCTRVAFWVKKSYWVTKRRTESNFVFVLGLLFTNNIFRPSGHNSASFEINFLTERGQYKHLNVCKLTHDVLTLKVELRMVQLEGSSKASWSLHWSTLTCVSERDEWFWTSVWKRLQFRLWRQYTFIFITLWGYTFL